MNEGKETYMTIEEVADYLKLAKQTIRKFVLNKSIPYRKVQKSVRFRLSEIEQWIDHGGRICPYSGAVHSTDRNEVKGGSPLDEREGDLFAGVETAGTGAAVETGQVADNEGERE
jgi:excisionase family DNA binding protein